jgi:hypothetical protein
MGTLFAADDQQLAVDRDHLQDLALADDLEAWNDDLSCAHSGTRRGVEQEIKRRR